MIDLNEWKAQVESRKLSQRQERSQALAFVHQASVRIDQLSQNPEWNFYLSLLQPGVDLSNKTLAEEMDKLTRATTDDTRTQALIAYWHAKGRLEGLTEAMNLPSTLRERARLAESTTPPVGAQSPTTD